MLAMKGLAVLLFLGLVSGAKFHTVNDFELDGVTPCEPIPTPASCSAFCVTDRGNCPGTSGSCGVNQTLCNDGACHAGGCVVEGAEIGNVCDCGGSGILVREGHNQVPCRTPLSGSFILGTAADFCTAGWGGELVETEISSTLACEGVPATTGGEDLFVAFYVAWGAFAALNIMWIVVKKSMESGFVAEKAGSEEIMTGYSDNILGSFVFLYYIVATLSWLALFGFVLNEYYVTFAAYLGYSYTRLHWMFLVTTVLSSLWYVFTRIVAMSLRNHYRIRVSFKDASYVAVWKMDPQEIMLEDSSAVTAAVRRGNEFFQSIMGVPGRTDTMEILMSSKSTRYFDYQCARFSYTGTTFSSKQTSMTTDCAELLKMSGGLTEAVGLERLEMYGENFIRVHVPNIIVAFAIEFSGFFYIYQFFILWVFFYWSYDYMGFIHGGMVLLSGLIRLFIKRNSELKIKSMAESNTRCNVLRNGKWREVNSLDLVPADVIKVGNNMVSPADAVVISGNCIVDEAQLTGEAMPVQKFTIAQTYEKMKGGKKNTLFAGTTVLESQAAPGEEHVLALVVDVGAHTEKGQLVSGILFAPPANFVFDEHLKFVFFVLFCWMIIALLIINSIAATVWPVTGLYFLFIASQVFPPLLPAVLVLAQSFSAGRLRLQNIFCVDLSRVTIAGKVRVFCFDKTGTLTTDGLAFDGLLPAVNKQFSAIVKESLPALLSQAIGCCHTVGKLGASFVGNPVDVEMFKKSGWNFASHDDGAIYTKSGSTIKVLKQHEFDHDRMSMAVVVLIDEDVHVFVKGSFEAVQKLSNPDSLPSDYNERAQNLAASGCYTLGIAHRNLGKMDPAAARALPRAEVESGNDCIALLMFRNNLKPDTADAIAVLKEGTVRPVMITGDTALTGVFIARKCGMVNKSATIVLGELAKKKGQDEAYASDNTIKDIVWTAIDAETNQKKGIVSLEDFISTMDTINVTVGDDVKAPESMQLSGAGRNYELAMTGAVFDVLKAEGSIIRQILPKCRVFARMTPVNKVECVQLHMEKNITAMCGDGGNDCGALRAAHVGIAMSEGEASIVSPFSTSDKSVFAAVTVLREGRCCLSTSFYAYDFILMYGESIVLAKLFYLYFGCQLAEWVWIFFEGMITPALGMSLSLAKPAAKLAPRRPTARLLGMETIFSVTGILLINLVFMFVSYVIMFEQEFYACNEWDSSKVDQSMWWLLADNYEGQLIGLLVMSQVLNAALVGNFSAGYRQNWFFNWVFVLLWLISYVIIALITLLDPNPVGCYMRFNCGDPDVLVSLGYAYAEGVTWTGDAYLAISGHNVFPTYFRWTVWGLGLANLVIVVVFVRFIVLGPVRTWLRANHGTARVQEC